MSNRLAQATSPYLLQHADNPVDWQPWDETALARARDQNKPILLSIGYSACHWCHVMAHESFEHADTAELMNERFVSIKVDREERPDLDRIYQIAHQVMTRRPGGWPLTVMLDPDNLAPFFTGTYFPRVSRHGLPAFTTVLTRTADWYRDNADQLDGQAERLREVFTRIEPSDQAAQMPDDEVIRQASVEFAHQFDADHGGFGGAPKFPHPSSLLFLLNHSIAGAPSGERARDMVTTTLTMMACGGLFDHIGGGFFRYSVDQRWEIPHFEKMLYDNGPLLELYARAYQVEATPLFARRARRTADWALREMRRPEGGFCASLDADTQGIEGGYYRWDPDQVKQILGDDYALAAAHFGVDQDANFEGHWHLTARRDEAELAQSFDLAAEEVDERLQTIRRRLFNARAQRTAPGRDDKVLTAWNALMIRGLAVAYQVFGETAYLDAAVDATDFLREALWQNARLLASWRNGQAHIPAYLDDHAFLLDALLALLEVRWRTRDLAWARELAELLLARFEDRERGGFRITADDHESLLYRPMTFPDESLPSGNAVAARGLLKLGHLLGEPRYIETAERCLRLAANAMSEQPTAHPGMLDALSLWLHEPESVIIRGEAAAIEQWRQALAGQYAPQRTVFAIAAGTRDLPPALADKPAPTEGDCVAYICRGPRCSPPIANLNQLLHQLSQGTSA